MIVDPVQAMASLTEFKKTTTTTAPLPTVTPLLPIYEEAGDTGERTLW
jgi:hypothetical protein